MTSYARNTILRPISIQVFTLQIKFQLLSKGVPQFTIESHGPLPQQRVHLETLNRLLRARCRCF
jgi:hypothetical protein